MSSRSVPAPGEDPAALGPVEDEVEDATAGGRATARPRPARLPAQQQVGTEEPTAGSRRPERRRRAPGPPRGTANGPGLPPVPDDIMTSTNGRATGTARGPGLARAPAHHPASHLDGWSYLRMRPTSAVSTVIDPSTDPCRRPLLLPPAPLPAPRTCAGTVPPPWEGVRWEWGSRSLPPDCSNRCSNAFEGTPLPRHLVNTSPEPVEEPMTSSPSP